MSKSKRKPIATDKANNLQRPCSDSESAALGRAILATDAEIVRLQTQIVGMKQANYRRGLELARRLARRNG